jgi:predicted hydrocarbon binding protein
MKGFIYTTFNDMVENRIGIACWESLLDKVKPASGGIYTSVEDFPDEELVAMLGHLSASTGTPVDELLTSFGQYLFHALVMKHPVFVTDKTDLFEFLKSIDGVIHKEVEKLYQNANLPVIDCEQSAPDMLLLHYRSPRKLCHLADGLIRGAAKQFNTEVLIAHDVCMHDGNDHCEFRIVRVNERVY